MTTALLATLACREAPAASRPQPAAPAVDPVALSIPPARPDNPSLREVEQRHATWQRHGPRDYVFVAQIDRQVGSRFEEQLRVVVRDGGVVEARSLLWGEGPPLSSVVTMDGIFARVEEAAGFGENGLPARFAAVYDGQDGHVISMAADGRDAVADDESGLRVPCFSIKPSGCRGIPLTIAQCKAVGGSLDCSNAGWSIGLVGEEPCCRTFSREHYDDISYEACLGAGAREADCGDRDTYVGSSQSRQTGCCRTLIAD